MASFHSKSDELGSTTISDNENVSLSVVETGDKTGDLIDFEISENPMERNVIIFQEQKEKVSLATLTGISSWSVFTDCLSQDLFPNKHDILDTMTLLLNNDEVEVGSKPLGTSSLDGAYTTVNEEINVKTFANKLISQELDNDSDNIYVISGISGSSINEILTKLATCLEITDNKDKIANHLGDIGSDSTLQIADDQFTDEVFKRICCGCPKKRLCWIALKEEENVSKLILRQFYNPNFYLKRDFKQIVIKNYTLSKQITKENFSDIIIFYGVNNVEEFFAKFQYQSKEAYQKIRNYFQNDRLFASEFDAKAAFEEFCKQNKVVHLLKFEDNEFIWFNSYGSVDNLRKCIDEKSDETSFIEEEDLIKDKKILIIADGKVTGKTTTVTKLYESEYWSKPLTETHWFIRINLKDHVQAVEDIEMVDGYINIVSVINFLSRADVKLNNNVAKSMLWFAFNKSEKLTKDLLIVFDGFNEISDVENRNKLMLLLKFLVEETAAIVWITATLLYKDTSEENLSTIAIQFNPVDYDGKLAYVKQYLKDRLSLILNEEIFAELFGTNGMNDKTPKTDGQRHRNAILNKKSKTFRRLWGHKSPIRKNFTDEIEDNKRILKYSKAFLKKTESIFGNNKDKLKTSKSTEKMMGIPLYLNLMLKGSTGHFKKWLEEDENEEPNFNYLNNHVW